MFLESFCYGTKNLLFDSGWVNENSSKIGILFFNQLIMI